MNRTVAKILIWSGIGMAVLFVASFGIGFYQGYRDAHLPEPSGPEIPALLFAVLIVGAMGASIWIGAIWMRSIDEAAQEAHKWAFYWGGSCGMAAGGALGLMSMLPQTSALLLPSIWGDRTDPAAYLATGAFMMVTVMTVGYGIAWAVWWLRRR